MANSVPLWSGVVLCTDHWAPGMPLGMTTLQRPPVSIDWGRTGNQIHVGTNYSGSRRTGPCHGGRRSCVQFAL